MASQHRAVWLSASLFLLLLLVAWHAQQTRLFVRSKVCLAGWPNSYCVRNRWQETSIPFLITLSKYWVSWGSSVQKRTGAYGLALHSDFWSIRRIVRWVWSDRRYIQVGWKVCVARIWCLFAILIWLALTQRNGYGCLFCRLCYRLASSCVPHSDVNFYRPSY